MAVAYQADAPKLLPLFGLGMFGLGVAFVGGAKSLSRDDVSWLSTTIQNSLNGA